MEYTRIIINCAKCLKPTPQATYKGHALKYCRECYASRAVCYVPKCDQFVSPGDEAKGYKCCFNCRRNNIKCPINCEKCNEMVYMECWRSVCPACYKKGIIEKEKNELIEALMKNRDLNKSISYP